MNFNAVRQGNGQNVTLSAVAGKIDPTTFIPSGTPKQECFFTDANGEGQKVTIWQGKGQPIPTDKVTQTLSINISYNTKKSSYGGFWNSNAQVAPLAQPTPQQPQQAPSAAPQSTNSPSEPDGKGKLRFQLVCAYLEGGKEPDVGTVDYWITYIMTGKAPIPPAKTVDDPNQDEQPPF